MLLRHARMPTLGYQSPTWGIVEHFVVCNPAVVTLKHEVSAKGDVTRGLPDTGRNWLTVCIAPVLALAYWQLMDTKSWTSLGKILFAFSFLSILACVPAFFVVVFAELAVTSVIDQRRRRHGELAALVYPDFQLQ